MSKNAIVLFIIVLNFAPYVIPEVSEHSDEFLRTKRQINSIPLVYPYGGTYKFIIGMSSPIQNREKVALVFAANMQWQYVQFANISELSQYYFIKQVSREQRDAEMMMRRNERLVFYRSISELLSVKGMNGPECVLRAICEAAQYPVEDEGFVGEILHVLLTPDYGHSPFDELEPAWEEAMSSYKDAAVAGRQMFSCAAIYSGCPQGQGILELITTLRDE